MISSIANSVRDAGSAVVRHVKENYKGYLGLICGVAATALVYMAYDHFKEEVTIRHRNNSVDIESIVTNPLADRLAKIVGIKSPILSSPSPFSIA